MNLSEKLLLDASEFLNAIYDDMSQINDILTLKDQTLSIEGAVLFYKGFQIVNTLDMNYIAPLLRIANMNDLFERSPASQDEVIIDYFSLRPNHQDIQILSPDLSMIADDDHIREITDGGKYLKLDEEQK